MEIAKWKEEIRKLPTEKLETLSNALCDLLEWPIFNEAYKGYGLDLINEMLWDAYFNAEEE